MTSKTLNLTQQLLDLGQTYLRHGREHDALRVLTKLIRLGDLSDAVAEAAQADLAEIYRRRGQYAQARRHLCVALARRPECAGYHHLLAALLDEEEHEDHERALYHYRRAVELAPQESDYHSDYGQYLLALGETEEGLAHLEQAVELAPDDLTYVHELAVSLADVGQFTQARRVVLAALFRNPDDNRFRQLWDELRFREAQRTQRQNRQDCTSNTKRGRMLLPFVRQPARPAKTAWLAEGTVLRLDSAESPPPPHLSHREKRRQSR